MRRVAILLLGTVAMSLGAFAQPIDYAVSINGSTEIYSAGDAIYSLHVHADRSVDGDDAPFVVQLAVPPELDPPDRCTHDALSQVRFDANTRVLTWSAVLDNPYASRSCFLAFRVAPGVEPGTTFTLASTLSTPTPDPNPANNAATRTSVILAAADLGVTTAIDDRNVKPGATLTYTLTLTNFGPQEARSVEMVNQLSANVSFVSFEQLSGPPAHLEPLRDRGTGACYSPRCGTYVEARIGRMDNGSVATFRLVVNVKTSFEAARIDNRVQLISASTDPVLSNDRSDLAAFAGPHADLKITTQAPDVRGLRVPITIHVTNEGEEAVNEVTLTNDLRGTDGLWDFTDFVTFVDATPSQGVCNAPEFVMWPGSPIPPAFWTHTCALGALAPGASATITFTIDRTQSSGTFDLTSFVTPAENDPNIANNDSAIHFTPSNPRKRAVRK
jgi:uncharacterized repeat protein (TIGR01451 family)